MTIFVGNDWAEAHHDVHVMNEFGERLDAKRLPEGLEGIRRFHQIIADQNVQPGDVVIGIETERSLWVQALLAAGYQVYAINPLSVSRYRDRHNVAGAKSDPGDAKLLADLVRTDRHNHRQISGDSDQAHALKVLARAHQGLIWTRTEHSSRLRNNLREYYPSALEAFNDLSHRDTLAVLSKAPTPAKAKQFTIAQVRTILQRAGRKRNLDTRAQEIRTALRGDQLMTTPAICAAFGVTTVSTVRILIELNSQIEELESALTTLFEAHPDTEIYRSQPGLGVVLSARVLAEFGDDNNRYATAKSRRNYAGTSPITIASGRKRVVTARHVRNRRLYDAIAAWAFSATNASPGCRSLYGRHRAAGDLHHQALRAVANRLVSILHGCLKHHTPYEERTAWPQQTKHAT